MPFFVEILSTRRKLVTTPLVLMECGIAVARRTYRANPCDLRQALQANEGLIEPTLQDIAQALARRLPKEAASATSILLGERQMGIYQYKPEAQASESLD